jgi:hypothetical protein
MEPFQPRVECSRLGGLKESQTNSAPSKIGMHCRVQDEPVHSTIPRDVYESNQSPVMMRREVHEAPSKHRGEVAGFVGLPRRSKQRVEIGARNWRAAINADFAHDKMLTPTKTAGREAA